MHLSLIINKSKNMKKQKGKGEEKFYLWECALNLSSSVMWMGFQDGELVNCKSEFATEKGPIMLTALKLTPIFGPSRCCWGGAPPWRCLVRKRLPCEARKLWWVHFFEDQIEQTSNWSVNDWSLSFPQQMNRPVISHHRIPWNYWSSCSRITWFANVTGLEY